MAGARKEEQNFHAHKVSWARERLNVDPEQGLDPDEAEDRLKRHGPNELESFGLSNPLRILAQQFKSVVILVLAAAAVPAVAFGQWPEAIAIAAVVLVNTGLGFLSEWKATQTIQALKVQEAAEVTVRRGGREKRIPVHDLVPGDVVRMEEGELVPADLRLLETEQLRSNEAALTGESVPVNKGTDPVDEEAPLAERGNMLYKGTSLAQGKGLGLVVATGMETELGKIARQAREAESAEEPLRERLDRLGKHLAIAVVMTAVGVAGLGIIAGREIVRMIETSIALGVAAIPEGLPIVATLALARGMHLMAQRNAVVKQLNSVQSLGSTPVIFTDKTGTVTENRMSVRRLTGPGNDLEISPEKATASLPELLRRGLEIGVLCNGASLAKEGEARGDPMETALLRAGLEYGLERPKMLETQPEERVVDFDPDVMMMASFHSDGEGLRVAVKGAPEHVLEVCTRVADDDHDREFGDSERKEWEERAESLAGEGLRLLAFAEKRVKDARARPYEDLTFVGLVGLMDPPREEVREAVDTCEAAGLRVIMVTGDKPATAEAVARKAGFGEEDEPLTVINGRDLPDLKEIGKEEKERLLAADVFARLQPEQKLRLVELYQDEGLPCAMTGDGINDAPALKKANIGVAMGQRGTDAAKQAADIVLRDDAFATIVAAVRQGRVIFSNIRQSAMFMLTTNFAEILAVAVGALLPYPLPLLALQILFLNVVTDVFPALALGVGPGNAGVIHQKPRDPDEGILNRGNWTEVILWGVLMGAVVMGALFMALKVFGLEGAAATTVSFLTLGFAKLWFPFNLRHSEGGFLHNEITRNPWIWASIGLCALLLLAAVYLPGLNTVLQTQPPAPAVWAALLGLSLIPWVMGQLRFAMFGARP